ncbi:extracellular catalytic domain type 2 short-chain-length polyhydroxyalkanoate depolymerase [Alteromonas sp. D210916BOD_24]|uniref:extracellular catalytic domain type 2 short-chain-length polyhydroxyalkanoate depolymerase n=1 Tax=Alteromonas sp. D210916BOD_24 TaxID=3157618 RepID=UPI00399C8CD4
MSVCAYSEAQQSTADTTKSNHVPALRLDLSDVTVSGLSSGGYMATQFQLAHSDWVKGVGVLAAGPYYCAQGDITTALSQCVNKIEGEIDLEKLQQQAEAYAAQGKIAPLRHMKDAKIWLFRGTHDMRVSKEVNNLLYQQYQKWTDTQNITYVNDKPMAHLFPTTSRGVNCIQTESPYIGNCDYDAAGDMLSHLLDGLTAPDTALSGTVYTIDQQRIAGDDAKTLASEGFVYVPESCAQGEQCRAHISFHGCNQYADVVGDAYVTQTGINEWADDNRIVVLYPQTKKSLFMPLNPQGCWDWWGYSSSDYANRDGVQISAVKQMLVSLNTLPATMPDQASPQQTSTVENKDD